MNELLKEGRKLLSIFWSDESVCRVGVAGVTEITISMEYGQMAKVPWALVKATDKPDAYYNLATTDGVLFLDE